MEITLEKYLQHGKNTVKQPVEPVLNCRLYPDMNIFMKEVDESNTSTQKGPIN